jgi:MoaA/NifB/PqqE/SkfB family radical SAM enzyme
VDIQKLQDAIQKILKLFDISSIMTYGGEPLLFPDVTIRLHQIFKEHSVLRRELITNGFFSHDRGYVSRITKMLIKSGVTKILLSVDAFHQEHIPIESVEVFIDSLLLSDFHNVILHPAWLVSKEHDNEYNNETRLIIDRLKTKFNTSVSNGNVIVPTGFSRNELAGYYKSVDLDTSKLCGEIPYTNPLTHITNLRFLPNGNVNICRGICIGNIFENRIEDILNNYSPHTEQITSLLLNGGVSELVKNTGLLGGKITPNKYFGVCDLCADCIKVINQITKANRGLNE